MSYQSTHTGAEIDASVTNSHTHTNKTVLDATTASFTTAEETKLSGIAEGANNYTHPSHTAYASGFYKVTSDALGHITSMTAVTKSDITALDIPAQDTTYSVATSTTDGLLSSTYFNYITRTAGINTVTTLVSLPVDKDVIYATLSTATNISLASALSVGQCLTIVINPSAAITQPIPTSGGFLSLDGDSISLTSGELAEISIICYATGYYSISSKVTAS